MILIGGTSLVKEDLPNHEVLDYQIEDKNLGVKLKIAAGPVCLKIYLREDLRSEYTITSKIENKLIFFKDDEELITLLGGKVESNEKEEADEIARIEKELEEKAAELAEQERLEAERLAKEKEEEERLEKERERLAKEKAELEEQERLEAERLAKEKAELEEQIAKEKAEKERLAKEKAEKERLEQERLEQERLEQERIEQERLEQERLEKEKVEQERLEQERLEKERLEKERLEQERLEKERLEQERIEQERLEKERLEKERIAKEKAEQERLEQERLEKERLEQERLEKERLEQERLEKERLEQERIEKERLEQERLEQERLEQERIEQERLEQERLEQERIEQERLEQERLEQERLEQERLEQERLEQEKVDQETEEEEIVDVLGSIDKSVFEIPEVESVEELKQRLEDYERIIRQKEVMLEEKEKEIEVGVSVQESLVAKLKLDYEEKIREERNKRIKLEHKLEETSMLDVDMSLVPFSKYAKSSDSMVLRDGFTASEKIVLGQLKSKHTILAIGPGRTFSDITSELEKGLMGMGKEFLFVDVSNDPTFMLKLQVKAKVGAATINMLKDEKSLKDVVYPKYKTLYMPASVYDDIGLLTVDWAKKIREIDDFAGGRPVIYLFNNIQSFAVKHTVSKLASVMNMWVFSDGMPATVILTALTIRKIPKDRYKMVIFGYKEVTSLEQTINQLGLSEVRKYGLKEPIKWNQLNIM